MVFIVTRWRYESRAKLMLSGIPIDNSAIRCHKQAPCNGDSVMVVEVVATQESKYGGKGAATYQSRTGLPGQTGAHRAACASSMSGNRS